MGHDAGGTRLASSEPGRRSFNVLATSLRTLTSTIRLSRAHLPHWHPTAGTPHPLPPRLQRKRSPIPKLSNMGDNIRVPCELPTEAHDSQLVEKLSREQRCHAVERGAAFNCCPTRNTKLPSMRPCETFVRSRNFSVKSNTTPISQDVPRST